MTKASRRQTQDRHGDTGKKIFCKREDEGTVFKMSQHLFRFYWKWFIQIGHFPPWWRVKLSRILLRTWLDNFDWIISGQITSEFPIRKARRGTHGELAKFLHASVTLSLHMSLNLLVWPDHTSLIAKIAKSTPLNSNWVAAPVEPPHASLFLWRVFF